MIKISVPFVLVLYFGLIFASMFTNVELAFAQTANDSFSAKGSISSLISSTNKQTTTTTGISATSTNKTIPTTTAPQYRLTGTWNMNVSKGNVTNFDAVFNMVLTNGTNPHMHEITNFHNKNSEYIQLNPEGTAFIVGTANVKTNGADKWKNVGATIIIDKLKAIDIILDPNATANHFNGQPIKGFTNSIRDQTGKEMIQSTATGPSSPPAATTAPPQKNATHATSSPPAATTAPPKGNATHATSSPPAATTGPTTPPTS